MAGVPVLGSNRVLVRIVDRNFTEYRICNLSFCQYNMCIRSNATNVIDYFLGILFIQDGKPYRVHHIFSIIYQHIYAFFNSKLSSPPSQLDTIEPGPFGRYIVNRP